MNCELVFSDFQPSHRIWVTRDSRDPPFLVEAFFKVPNGVKSVVYRLPSRPSVDAIQRLARQFTYVSPRPYQLGQGCDGSISSPVLALFAAFCESRQLSPVAVMLDAYPEEAARWGDDDFVDAKQEAAWQGVAYPATWDAAACRGLLDSLSAINYHSLVSVVSDLLNHSE